MQSDLTDIVRKVYYPKQVKYLNDTQRVLEQWIVGDYAPEAPIISPSDTIACIGSCFAGEMAKSLEAQGRNVIPIYMSERWSTAFAVSHFVDFALKGTLIPEGFIPSRVSMERLGPIEGGLDAMDAIIITLGLSLCWFEMATDKMVLEPPAGHSPGGLAEAFTKYTMRQTSLEENIARIAAIIATIRERKPVAPIILTVSPVPLLASVTDYPVVASNNISKAILRAAVHSVMEQRLDHVYYWPSYDIVEWYAKYHGPIFGQDGRDLRHLSPEVVTGIMRLFSRYYFRES